MTKTALPSDSGSWADVEQDPMSGRPTVAEIDLAALRHNLAAIRAHVAPAKVMGIVKANAYGHGLVRIAQEMERVGVDQLGVALVEEGIMLRRAGVRLPILVLGGLLADQIPLFLEHDLSITASSVYKLERIEEAAAALGKHASVHLKFDTGMERLGVHHGNAWQIFEAAAHSKHCDIQGVFSHLANSQSVDPAFTNLQLERFLEATSWYEQHGEPLPPRHLANSGGVLQHPATWFDLVRPGLMCYGVYPDPAMPRTLDLQPVLSLKTRVVYFKVTEAGRGIGYDSTWVAPHDTRIVTLPIGYADGYRRGLSNRGQVLIRGQRHDVVGNVSMDQILVDIGPEGTAYNGDEVVIIGRQGEEFVDVDEVAAGMGSISYEVLTGISARVPRVYLHG